MKIFKNTHIYLFVFILLSFTACGKKTETNKIKEESVIEEKLNLPEQNLSPEKIEEIKRTVKPRKFETIEDANRWLDSIDKVYGKTISEEEYQRAIDSLESQKK